MSCTYTYKGKTYAAWEFADLLESMPVDELMKYLPMEAKRKLMMLSGDRPRTGSYGSQELENALRGKSVIEVAEHIVNTAPNEDYRIIASKVLDRIQELTNVGAKFSFNIANAYTIGPALLSVSRGVTGFSVGGNEHSSVDVWVNGYDVAGRSGMTYETVLHELIHASMKSLTYFSNAPHFQDTPYAKNIEDLYSVTAHIQDYVRYRYAASLRGEIELNDVEKAIVSKSSNAITNADEILSWGMTNRKVQEYFDSIPYQGRGAWSAFVDAIRSLLGLQPRQQTALSEILRVADEMYSMPLFAMNERAKLEGWMMQRVMPEGENSSAQSAEGDFSKRKSNPEFRSDVPNEQWLAKQVDYAREQGRNQFGVPYMGKTTGYFRGGTKPVVNVSFLARLDGERGEQSNVRKADLEWLKKEMAENGLKNVGVPYIEVGYDGVPWVSEGNHRIMAAQALGWESMPIEIRYFDGGERVDGLMSPQSVMRKHELYAGNSATSPKHFNEYDQYGDPSPEEAKFVHEGIIGKNPIEVAAWLEQNAPKQYAAVATHVREKLESMRELGIDFGMEIPTAGDSAHVSQLKARGATYPVQQESWKVKIVVSVNGSDMKGRVGTSFRTVTHELVHAATTQSIRLGELGVPQYKGAAKDLMAVALHVGNNILTNIKNGTASEFEISVAEERRNMLQNPGELVAWALASYEAQAYLDSIPYEGKSAWTKFVEAIRKVFGLNPSNDSALSEVLRVSEILLQPSKLEDIFGINVDPNYEIQEWTPIGFDGIDRRQQQPGGGKYFTSKSDSRPDVVWSSDATQASIDFSLKGYRDSAVEKASKLRDRLERSDSLFQNKIASVIDSLTGDTAKTFNWYHKSFGSQYHKAKIDPHFGKVYHAAQSYIEDIARYGTEAANLAPGLLPKMDTIAGAWREVRHSIRDGKDQEAISAPIYAGTLEYARDKRGNLYKTDDVHEAGVVFEDAELRDLFNLDDRQIGLYRQFRKAVDHSLEVMAIAEMNKVAKVNELDMPTEEMSMDNLANFYAWQYQDELAALRARYDELVKVHEANLKQLKLNADALRMTREQYAQGKAQMESDQAAEHNRLFREIERLEKLDEAFKGKQATINKLKMKGYAPLMRFGKYTVDVVKEVPALDEDGNHLFDKASGEQQMTEERVFFGMFESENEARKAERALSEEYPDHLVRRGVSSEDSFQLFGGVNPGSLEALIELVGKEDEIVQRFYKEAVASRSALKRLIHRQGTAGYSKDVVRSLASFLMSNARATASADHFGDMIEAATHIPKSKGDVADEAVKLINYIRNPNEEAGTLRGLLFMQFLGGSIAAAAVNLTQTITTTLPYLNQYGIKVGDLASSGVLAAKRMAGKAANIDPELSAALSKAEEEGVVAPHNIHVLMGQSGLQGLTQNKVFRMASHLWGSFFGMAEQFNRETAFIAAYQLAQKMGASGLKKAYDQQSELNASRGLPPPDRKAFANAFEFAKNAVNDTQFVLSKAARSNFARGPVGATLLTFKTFSIMYMELFKRLPNKERAIMLGTLILLAGLGGLPFDDDMDDLIDTLGQAMGYNTNANKWKDQVLLDLVGDKTAADFVMHGVSAFLPLELSSRLGMNNLVPATSLLKKSNSGSHERDYSEILGAAGGYMKQVMDAWDYTLKGRYDMALVQGIAPKAIKDAYKALDMASTGVYEDTRGRRVTDVDGIDALVKLLGFQPTKISSLQRTKGQEMQDIALTKAVKSAIAEIWAEGNFNRDPALSIKARAMLADWNAKNPESPIKIDMGAVQRRVKQMGMTAQERLVKTAPKEMRAAVRESLR